MITLIAAGVIMLALIVIIVGVVDAAQASRWKRVAAERRERWETRQLMLHGAYMNGRRQGFNADTSAELRVYFAGTLVPGPEVDLPDTHATGMNDATRDINEVLNFMGPPPEWSGRASCPVDPVPAGAL